MSSRRATAAELAVLRHPDQRTPWTVGLTVVGPAVDLVGPENVAELVAAAPVVGVRWRRGRWWPGPPPALTRGRLPPLLRPFDLAHEAPLRLAVDGPRLHLAGHHAALDGLGLLAVARALLRSGDEKPAPPSAGSAAPADKASSRSPLSRLVRPADRVSPSAERPPEEAMAARTVDLSGPRVTARLTAGAVAALARRNASTGARLRRVGISLGVGGEDRIANTASYRRVDLDVGDRGLTLTNVVLAAAQAALADPHVPTELRRPSPLLRLLAPVAHRLSDTVLVSNLGRHDLPGVERVEFYPVARGRSAVSFGAAGLQGGTSSLTIRARDLNQDEAEALLDATVVHLGASESG